MTKTRVTYEAELIEFSDIKAGDMIELRWKEDGVTDLSRGIAFKFHENYVDNSSGWFTSEGGLIVSTHTDTLIYRITPVSSEEVK